MNYPSSQINTPFIIDAVGLFQDGSQRPFVPDSWECTNPNVTLAPNGGTCTAVMSVPGYFTVLAYCTVNGEEKVSRAMLHADPVADIMVPPNQLLDVALIVRP